MVSCKEAIEAYILVLQGLGKNILKYQFKVDNGKICIGHVWGTEVDEVQWAIMWHTPEEFLKMANRRRTGSALAKKVGGRFVEVDRESL